MLNMFYKQLHNLIEENVDEPWRCCVVSWTTAVRVTPSYWRAVWAATRCVSCARCLSWAASSGRTTSSADWSPPHSHVSSAWLVWSSWPPWPWCSRAPAGQVSLPCRASVCRPRHTQYLTTCHWQISCKYSTHSHWHVMSPQDLVKMVSKEALIKTVILADTSILWQTHFSRLIAVCDHWTSLLLFDPGTCLQWLWTFLFL